MRKRSVHMPKGMAKDLSASKFGSEFYYDALNIRLTPSDSNTLLSITNVKSNADMELHLLDINGNEVTDVGTWKYIGHVVLNSYVVVFAIWTYEIEEDNVVHTVTYNMIYLIDFTTGAVQLLAQGDFGFSSTNPIEGLGIFEKEEVQKVYWIDGLNQPRFINIVTDTVITDSTKLDFVRTLNYGETVTVRRNTTTMGFITPGTIQYVFTYFNAYGQESNIFYHSPLNYISYPGRGASPEDTKVSSSFTITINNPDTSFEYVRIYSIHRGSTDAVPECRRIVDIPVGNRTQIVYVDDGTNGDTIDPTVLLYIGGKEIVPYAMEQKDNTLFFGNYLEKGSILSDTLKTGIRNANADIQFSADKEVQINKDNPTLDYYSYKHQLSNNSSQITTFKYLETYRFGVQLQKPTGEWSEPMFIRDAQNTAYPSTSGGAPGENFNSSTVKLVQALYTLPSDWVNSAITEGYVRARPIVVYPSLMDRTVICQGVLNPTVFNVGDRATNSPFAQASWFFRPNYKEYTEGTSGSIVPTFPVLIVPVYNKSSVFPERGTWIYLRKSVNDSSIEVTSYQYYGCIKLTNSEDATDKIDAVVLYNKDTTGTYNGVYSFDLKKVTGVGNNQTITYINVAQVTPPNVLDDTVEMYTWNLPVALCKLNDNYLAWDTENYVWSSSNNQYTIEIAWNTATYTVSYSTHTSDITVPGTLTQFVHYKHLPFSDKRNAEIQCNYYNSDVTVAIPSGQNKTYYINKFSDLFFVDQSIVTLNSPEIDFDTSMQHIEDSTLKLRIVGYVPITSTIGDYDITVSTPQLNYFNTAIQSKGMWHEFVGMQTVPGCYGLNTIPSWFDEMYGYKYTHFGSEESNGLHANSGLKTYGYAVYPWHRSGSMNNQPSATLTDGTGDDLSNVLIIGQPAGYRSAMLKRKVLSNLRYSANTMYDIRNGDTARTWAPAHDISVSLFNSDALLNTRLEGQTSYDNKAINYYGNIDKVLMSERKFTISGESGDSDTTEITGYPIFATAPFPAAENNAFYHAAMASYNLEIAGTNSYDSGEGLDKSYRYGYDPISMKYKSGAHAVICMKGSGNSVETLPRMADAAGSAQPVTGPQNSFWAGNIEVQQDELSTLSELQYGYLWLGELYNDMHSVDANGNLVSDDSESAVESTRFGGTSDSAIEGNTWLPAGEAIDLVYIGNTESSSDEEAETRPENIAANTIIWEEGDTYYQRYDCLKTYPYTNEDPNSIVDICSFMVETRVNIEGRYDRNRGQMSNLTMTPLNFNLLNPGYTQQNNFFKYRILDQDLFTGGYYPNYITWTKTKSPGEETDTWTNVTLANVLDLDGDKGPVTAIKRFNNTLFSFQDKGIAQILYNEQMQISTTEGVPIEIANSGKVQGKRYITETVGCQNKWAIATSPYGLYFMDSYNKTLNRLSQGIEDLTNIFGFNSWAENNIQTGIWDADRQVEGAYRMFYDGNNKDVFFVGSHSENDCLVYSEALNQFTSFYSWGNAMDIFNVDDGLYAFGDNTSLKLYRQYGGEDYCRYFGSSFPFHITYIDAQDPLDDKTYTNLEVRATVKEDGFAVNDSFNAHLPFDMLDVWNEYQHGRAMLENNRGLLSMQHHLGDNTSSLKRKFRIWRCDIPRDNAPLNTDEEFGISRLSRKPLDRIRNPWTYIRLYKDEETSDREVQIHDMIVDYFV